MFGWNDKLKNVISYLKVNYIMCMIVIVKVFGSEWQRKIEKLCGYPNERVATTKNHLETFPPSHNITKSICPFQRMFHYFKCI